MENTVPSLVQLARKIARVKDDETKNKPNGSSKLNITGTSSSSLKQTDDVNNPNRGTYGPLALFPEELWELIVSQLNQSQDIFNFVIAFPELDGLFHNKKPNLLFQLVLPHIMTNHLVLKHKHGREEYWYLKSKHLFGLRLVSKRWKYAVETCIQNHSDRHPPLPKSQTDNTLIKQDEIIPEHHFSYQRMHKYHFGATVFQETEEVEKFLKEMENFDGNPFPGKFVYCNILEPKLGPYISNIRTCPLFVPKIVEMLEKFGKFIHVLDFLIYDFNESNLENFKIILKSLSYVPNLTSLTIRGELDATEDTTTDEFFNLPDSQSLFPELPFLKIFDWQVITAEESSWVNKMIDKYAKQNNCLRKLGIEEYYCKDQLVSNMRNLSELHLYLDTNMEYTVTSIRNVLNLFPVGQLRKFCLSDNPIPEKRDFNLKELLETIDEFQIETVVFEKFLVKTSDIEEDFASYARNTSSITSLWLDYSSDLNMEFLKMLPNLRCLRVYLDDDFDEKENDLNTFTGNLRCYFVQADCDEERVKSTIPGNFSIWHELPKLEALFVSRDHAVEIVDAQFVRECGNKSFMGYRFAKPGEYGY